MTRKNLKPSSGSDRSRGGRQPRIGGHWALQDAKARFSELVRLVHSEGPQHVSVHGKSEVVVIAAEEFRRLKGAQTGAAIVAAMQAIPDPDLEFEFPSVGSPIRDVKL